MDRPGDEHDVEEVGEREAGGDQRRQLGQGFGQTGASGESAP